MFTTDAGIRKYSHMLNNLGIRKLVIPVNSNCFLFFKYIYIPTLSYFSYGIQGQVMLEMKYLLIIQ